MPHQRRGNPNRSPNRRPAKLAAGPAIGAMRPILPPDFGEPRCGAGVIREHFHDLDQGNAVSEVLAPSLATQLRTLETILG